MTRKLLNTMRPTSAATQASKPLSARPAAAPALSRAGEVSEATEASEDAALEAAIFKLLAQRQSGTSICPSDAARAVYPDAAQWRAAMPKVRALAARLVDDGLLEVTQRGAPADVRTAVGPVRLCLRKP
jgi:Protein of unknown function (DUF3253)